MSCLEHSCNDCFNTWFNNLIEKKCPRCGSDSIGSCFDEPPSMDLDDIDFDDCIEEFEDYE